MSGPPKEKKPSPPRPSKSLGGLSHSEQLELYAHAKSKAAPVVEWMLNNAPDLVKQADLLDSCAKWLIFHSFGRLNKSLLVGGMTCKQHLLCAGCALRRSSAYTKAYHPVASHLLAENPEYLPVFITKTIRNAADLNALYKQFKRAHSSLLQSRRHALRPNSTTRISNPTVYASLFGGFGSYEFKRGKNSLLWHPHSHEVSFIKASDWKIEPVEVKRWRKIDGQRQLVTEIVWKPLELERRLREEWFNLTGGSHICDVRMIGWDENGNYDPEELFYAVAEVMGYALKMGNISPADMVEAYRVFRTHRLIYTYGAFRNVKLPPEAYDLDETIPEDEPWIELQYRWFQRHYGLEVVRPKEEALFRRIKGRPKQIKAKTIKITNTDTTLHSQVADWLADMKQKKGQILF